MKYDRQAFENAPDDVKLRIIADEVNLETHNGTTKEDLLMLLKWIYDEAIDHEEYDREMRKKWIKRRTEVYESVE